MKGKFFEPEVNYSSSEQSEEDISVAESISSKKLQKTAHTWKKSTNFINKDFSIEERKYNWWSDEKSMRKNVTLCKTK